MASQVLPPDWDWRDASSGLVTQNKIPRALAMGTLCFCVLMGESSLRHQRTWPRGFFKGKKTGDVLLAVHDSSPKCAAALL